MLKSENGGRCVIVLTTNYFNLNASLHDVNIQKNQCVNHSFSFACFLLFNIHIVPVFGVVYCVYYAY